MNKHGIDRCIVSTVYFSVHRVEENALKIIEKNYPKLISQPRLWCRYFSVCVCVCVCVCLLCFVDRASLYNVANKSN